MAKLQLPPDAPRKHKRYNYQRQESFRSRLCDIYANARCFRQDADTLIEEKRVFWSHVSAQCTQAERSFLSGYDRALWDRMYQTDLVWMLGDASGPQGYCYVEVRDKTGVPPTHGGHRWKSDESDFSGWEAFDRPAPSEGQSSPR